MGIRDIYSWLSSCTTAKGSSTRLFHLGPTKVKARKFLYPNQKEKKQNQKLKIDNDMRVHIQLIYIMCLLLSHL